MKVYIELESTITGSDGEKDTITHKGNAMLKETNGLYRLSFPISGVMQTLVFDRENPGQMELQREGDRLVFDTSCETEGRYKTEYFTLFPHIQTKNLTVLFLKSSISLRLSYKMDISGEIQHFDMAIEVKYASDGK